MVLSAEKMNICSKYNGHLKFKAAFKSVLREKSYTSNLEAVRRIIKYVYSGKAEE